MGQELGWVRAGGPARRAQLCGPTGSAGPGLAPQELHPKSEVPSLSWMHERHPVCAIHDRQVLWHGSQPNKGTMK